VRRPELVDRLHASPELEVGVHPHEATPARVLAVTGAPSQGDRLVGYQQAVLDVADVLHGGGSRLQGEVRRLGIIGYLRCGGPLSVAIVVERVPGRLHLRREA